MSKKNILIVVLVIIILILGGYIVYDKVIKNNSNNDPINMELALNLLEKIDANYSMSEYYFFNVDANNKILNQNNMNNKLKLDSAFQYYLSYGNVEKNSDFENNEYDETLEHTSKYYMRINKKDYIEAYYSLFGNKDINYEDFFENVDGENYKCFFEEEYINCYDSLSGGASDEMSLFDFKNYKKYDNKIEIIVEGLAMFDKTIYNKGYPYKDNNIITNNFDISLFDFNGNNENLKKILFNKFSGKGQLYKITFEKNTNEDKENVKNWYWISTELI